MQDAYYDISSTFSLGFENSTKKKFFYPAFVLVNIRTVHMCLLGKCNEITHNLLN